MENIKEVIVEDSAGNPVTHIIIDRGNGEFTSMPKAVWDELQTKAEGGAL